MFGRKEKEKFVPPVPQGPERRKAVRANAVVVADIQDKKSGALKGRSCLTDLGSEGLGFESRESFRKDEEIMVSFDLPVTVRGTIVHAGKRGNLNRYGIRFTQVEDAEKGRIEKFVVNKFKK